METKSYKTVYDEKGSFDKILKEYNYCKSDYIPSKSTSRGKEAYFDIIRSVLQNEEKQYSGDIDFSLMNEINWIALWKTNRIIELDSYTRKLLLELKSKDYSYNEDEVKTLLENMLKCKGIQIAMASTILHFYRPDLFPIIDKRAWRAVHNIINEEGEISLSIDEKPQCNEFLWNGKTYKRSISRTINMKIKQYLDYIELCRHLSDKLKIDFKKIDQFLYEIDKLSGADINDVHIYETQKEDH